MRTLPPLLVILSMSLLALSCSQPDSAGNPAPAADMFTMERHEISRDHPRLLGSAEYLRQLAVQRPEAWARTLEQAHDFKINGTAGAVSSGLAYVIEGDEALGMHAKKLALEIVRAGIKKGHVRFGDALANIALAYDLSYPLWSADEKQEFFRYFDQTVEANTGSEPHVFHNGWYSYKHWGYGLAGYATYYEHERSRRVLADLEREYRERVLPAFALAGDGGGWGEGYYVNYWIYEWTFFCEVARRVEGLDYFGISPEFMGQRAIAGMFEMYPGIDDRHSRRPIPMGDSGGRVFGSDRDKTLAARRILVNRFRDDPAHQVVHTFNETTPRTGAAYQAYMDFLWRDTTVPKGDLASFRTSHVSTGPGYVYARSSWDEDATYFFFKCGDRFTAHQHLDNGHFLIYRGGELAADGGQYYYFGTDHDVNYHLRTVAHSTLRVYDPEESWHNIRAFEKLFDGVMDNDGGQHHDFPHHNGAVADAAQWNADRELYDIADLLAFQDEGRWLYTAGDCSRSYKRKKLEYFTRQLVYIRPGTFVIFDRVRTTKPEYEKTWQLMAMTLPQQRDPWQVVTNGEGLLFVQTLLPEKHTVSLRYGDELHSYYGGQDHPPEKDRGHEPACRIEIKPPKAATVDYFLHVLTVTGPTTEEVPVAAIAQKGENGAEIVVELEGIKLAFTKNEVGGGIDFGGGREQFTDRIIKP